MRERGRRGCELSEICKGTVWPDGELVKIRWLKLVGDKELPRGGPQAVEVTERRGGGRWTSWSVFWISLL